MYTNDPYFETRNWLRGRNAHQTQRQVLQVGDSLSGHGHGTHKGTTGCFQFRPHQVPEVEENVARNRNLSPGLQGHALVEHGTEDQSP